MENVDAAPRPQSPALSVDTPTLEWLFEEPSPPSLSVPPTVALKPKYSCAICKRTHLLRFCRRFKRMDLEHRLRAVVKFGYCMRCLSSNHISRNCPSDSKCPKCNNAHHFMLHDDENAAERPQRMPKPRPLQLFTSSVRNSVRPVNQRAPSTKVLFPTCRLIIWVQGHPVKIRALLDQCSGMNYIAKQFSSSHQHIRMPASDGDDVELVVSPDTQSNERLPITARVTSSMLRPSTSFSCPQSVRTHFMHLHLADPHFDQPGPIHLVLGIPVYNHVMRSHVIAQPGYPHAQDSIFGWVLSGACST